jgi:Transposase
MIAAAVQFIGPLVEAYGVVAVLEGRSDAFAGRTPLFRDLWFMWAWTIGAAADLRHGFGKGQFRLEHHRSFPPQEADCREQPMLLRGALGRMPASSRYEAKKRPYHPRGAGRGWDRQRHDHSARSRFPGHWAALGGELAIARWSHSGPLARPPGESGDRHIPRCPLAHGEEAREIVAAFQAMVRKKSLADLEPWLDRARSSLVASFANGVIKDQAAVSAAITSPWSNGQTEGQITKLKLVKRQMYGRGKLDLLQARVIGPA